MILCVLSAVPRRADQAGCSLCCPLLWWAAVPEVIGYQKALAASGSPNPTPQPTAGEKIAVEMAGQAAAMGRDGEAAAEELPTR